MENIGLVLSPRVALARPSNHWSPTISSKPFFGIPNLLEKTGKVGRYGKPTSSFSPLAVFQGPKTTKTIVTEKVARDSFASISSSKSQETTSVGVTPQLSVPPPSSVGSPLFWIGVGVGLSALFSWVAGRTKNYAMEQALKTLTQQMNTQNNPYGNNVFSPGSPFPFPPSTTRPPDSSRASAPVASQAVTVDVSATKVEDPQPVSGDDSTEPKKETKKYAFVDVSPEETVQKNAFEGHKESTQTDSQTSQPDVQNGSATKSATGTSEGFSAGKSNPLLSVDALEKMMEDPTVQKMVYPYLPEEMRNPSTFKWMLQNPQYRQQLQDMLNNMGGSPEWDNRMMENLKNFDLSSPDVKQQFDQIGLTPEEVISKIMANPDVAMAFQNPRVQAAIMDCSQNPLNIAKYQNDKEVMDVFSKISELFPGAAGI